MKWPLIFLLIICIPGVFAISNSSNYAVDLLVSPGIQSNSSNFAIDAAIEPIIGSGESANYQICLGFFCKYIPFSAVILAISIALIGSVIFFAGWAKRSNHIPIQILFMFCVLMLSIASIFVVTRYYELISVTSGLIAVFTIVIAFFIITIFLDKKLYKYEK